jgi:hypothetical protein
VYLFRSIFVTLPIHILTGAVSLVAYLIFLRFFDHLYPVAMISIILLIFNVITYSLYSFYILRKYNFKIVVCSILLFLVVGLTLWKLSYFSPNDAIDNIYWIYHTVGYTSIIWYVEIYMDPFIKSYHHFGCLYSVMPSALLFFTFCLGKYMWKKGSNIT